MYTQAKTEKIYACKKATNNSKTIRIDKKANGKTPKIPIIITKNAITSNITCPAIIFAAKRTDKLIGLTKYENNSRTNNNGISHHGVPDGKNILKKPKPFFAKVINTQIKKTAIANAKVIEI